jgi:hypothetical protein
MIARSSRPVRGSSKGGTTNRQEGHQCSEDYISRHHGGDLFTQTRTPENDKRYDLPMEGEKKEAND